MGIKDKDYYDNKWKKAPIIYSGRALRTEDKRVGVDVKTFISSNDAVLQEIIKKYRLKKRNPDDTAWAIQKWVVRFLTYKYDSEANDVAEFWQFPFESIASRVGDCEDGSILIASLCINAGIPPFRVKVAAGYVQSAPTAPQGGHAYTVYLGEDGGWRILDWCYFEDSKLKITKKPLAKNGGQKNAYKDVWFTFNNENSWNQKSLKLAGRISNGKAGETYDLMEDATSVISMKDIIKDIDEDM